MRTPNQMEWKAFTERIRDGLGVVVTPHLLLTRSAHRDACLSKNF